MPIEPDTSVFANAILERGWAVTGRVLSEETIAALRVDVASLASDGRGGARNLLEVGSVAELAKSHVVRRLARSVLGDGCFAVRALLFDKTPAANWKVIWHQDLTIATREPAEVPGFGPWTEKSGVPHVQPPAKILESMLAIRLHLDPCGMGNGPVRVIDGSHRVGRLTADGLDALRRRVPETDCCVDQGGVLAFRPLIVHASAPAVAPTHRRVVHIEFAACDLPAPLEWHHRVA